MIEREIEQKIVDGFTRKKVTLILGPRQVGKTTLLRKLKEGYNNVVAFDCDYADDASRLEDTSRSELLALLQGHDMIQIDEAQRVKDIGLLVKKIGDLQLGVPVVVTGSSALELASGIYDTAVGRVIDYKLYPLSMRELAANTSRLEEDRLLRQRLVWGLYPEVVTDPANARTTLVNLTNDYLWKDLLAYRGVKRPEILRKLVQALALQVGSEVSFNELAQLLRADVETVETYIGLLEKCFILFRLPSFSRNQRNEIKKGKKVYFWDNGVRNALIGSFAPLDMRNDSGALWENFLVSERMKANAYAQSWATPYFWRTHDQAEIDYIEEEDGQLRAFEFKWNERSRANPPASFSKSYPNATFQVITPNNYWDFLG